MSRYKEFVYMTVLAISAVGLTACEDEDAPSVCARDFDCDPGFVCGDGSSAGELSCVAAVAGGFRDFGEVTFDVTNLDDTYLLSVFSVPRDDEVLNDFVPFFLNPGAGSAPLAVSKSQAGGSATAPAPVDDARWRARMELDGVRHAGVARLTAAVRAGERRTESVRPKAGVCSPCGSQSMCWQGSCVASGIDVTFVDGSAVTCSLAGVLPAGDTMINVLLDDANAADAQAALAAAQAFADTLDAEIAILGQSGHSGDVDRDADGRMTVVFTNRTGGSVTADIVGFFWPGDFLPASDSEATGNEADLLWARVPDGTNITTKISAGTLAHEYAHVVSYAVRVQARGASPLSEVLWLDEAIAHLMEDVTGWGASNIDAANAALQGWNDAGVATGDDSVEQRGRGYLFLRHYVDAAGSGDASSAATAQAAAALISGLLNEDASGWGHQVFQDDGAEHMWQMTLAAYATGRDDLLDAAHAYDFLPTGTSSATGLLMGMNTHGSYDDGRGSIVDLTGPDVSFDLDIVPDDFDSVVTTSGGIVYELTGLEAGSVTITGRADASSDLRLEVMRVQ